MNLNESELEERLRALRLMAPQSWLAESIAHELKLREMAPAVPAPATVFLARPAASARTFPSILRGLGWACAGACVVVAAVVFSERAGEQPQVTPVVAAEPAFDLSESSAEILSAQDEGFVYSGDEAPARRIRYSSIERHVWTDASTGARMEMEIPREDIRLLPVAMQ